MISALLFTLVIRIGNVADVPAPVVADAKAEVVRLLHEIDVDVEWTSVASANRPDTIMLTLVPYETGSLRDAPHQVLGSATRTALGTRVAWVFYRRVAEEAERHQVPVSRVLACAMAHEIGHLLQEVPSHTTEGLMSGVWTARDFRRASTGRLRFEPQRETHHRGMHHRASEPQR